MKNLKLFTLTIIALLAIGFSEVKAQEVVLIRSFEVYTKTTLGSAKILVTPSNGETIAIPLKKRYENVEENNKVIVEELNKWKKDGYKIIHVSSGSGDFVTTTFILEK